MGGYVRTGLLVLLSRILLVSGITAEQAKYQLQKNADRREFMGRMSASAALDFENEVLSGTEMANYNKKLRSKIRPRETGEFLPSSRRVEDGAAADDGGGEEEEWYEEEANYYNWNDLGVDIADYSLKYHKCNTMNSFIGEEDGGDNESPFVENTFVTFRLCPTDSCVADGWDGCRETYGEYMMGMEDFVEAQASYDEELFEQFCNYCQTCMYFENYFYGNNRRLSDQHAWACKYYDDCYNYESVCGDEDNEGGAALTLSTLVQCIPIEDAIQADDYYDDGNNNGENQYWLGLACRSTLQIALFSDEECSQFVSNSNKIFNVTGYDVQIDDDLMGPFLSHQCISCRESDQPYMISNADEDDEDDIIELCKEVYLASARCDQRLWEVEYENAVDQYYAERTCDFIENVIKGIETA